MSINESELKKQIEQIKYEYVLGLISAEPDEQSMEKRGFHKLLSDVYEFKQPGRHNNSNQTKMKVKVVRLPCLEDCLDGKPCNGIDYSAIDGILFGQDIESAENAKKLSDMFENIRNIIPIDYKKQSIDYEQVSGTRFTMPWNPHKYEFDVYGELHTSVRYKKGSLNSKRKDIELILKYGGLVDADGAIVIMTYNRVKPCYGVHCSGKLRIYDAKISGVEFGGDHAVGIAKRVIDQFYDDFDNLRQRGDEIAHVFLYSGLNAWKEMLDAALYIQHDLHGKVSLASCGCHYDEKKKTADAHDMDLIYESDLQTIANMIVEDYKTNKKKGVGKIGNGKKRRWKKTRGIRDRTR